MPKKFIEKYLYLVILILPFLEFINENYVEFDSFITLNFLLYSIAFIILIYLILIIFRKIFYFIDKDKFNLFFSIAFYLQFKFYLLKIFFLDFTSRYDGEIAFILIIIFTIVIFKFLKKQAFKNFVNIFFLLNFLFITSSITFGFAQKKSISTFKLDNEVIFFNQEQVKKISTKKNIYFVVIDGMLPLETYEEQYNLPTKKFRKFILSNNLNYFKNSFTSYDNTKYNFTAFMHLNYIINENDEIFLDRTKMYPNIMRPNLIKNLSLKKTLDDLGYKFVWEGWSSGNCFQYNFDLCIKDKKDYSQRLSKKYKLNSYIFNRFLTSTPIKSFYGRLKIYKFFNQEINLEFQENNAMGNLIAKLKNYNLGSAPHFFLIHHMSPHDPWIYNSDCTRRNPGEEAYPPTGYRLAYDCVLKRIQQLYYFLEKKDPEAIVIFQSDHGFGLGYNLNQRAKEYQKVFILMKLNKKCSKYDLNDKLDMVNNIRLALSCATNQKINLLEKKSYSSYPNCRAWRQHIKEKKLKSFFAYEKCKQKNYGKVFLSSDIDKVYQTE